MGFSEAVVMSFNVTENRFSAQCCERENVNADMSKLNRGGAYLILKPEK